MVRAKLQKALEEIADEYDASFFVILYDDTTDSIESIIASNHCILCGIETAAITAVHLGIHHVNDSDHPNSDETQPLDAEEIEFLMNNSEVFNSNKKKLH